MDDCDYFGLINILNTKISLSFQLIGLGKISLLVIYLSWLRCFKIRPNLWMKMVAAHN